MSGVLGLCGPDRSGVERRRADRDAERPRAHRRHRLAHYFFQYATRAADLDTQPAHRTPTRGPIPANVPGNGGDVAFGESVGGLTPGTTYYYRVCGRDGRSPLAVCARRSNSRRRRARSSQPHHFLEPVRGRPLTPALDDITSIGSRLYVSGGALRAAVARIRSHPCCDRRQPWPQRGQEAGRFSAGRTNGDHSRPGRRPLGPDRSERRGYRWRAYPLSAEPRNAAGQR